MLKKLFFTLALSLLLGAKVAGQNVEKVLLTADNGFKWYLLSSNGVFGAEDKDGKELIPLSRGYNAITYCPELHPQIPSEKDFKRYSPDEAWKAWYKYEKGGYFKVIKHHENPAWGVEGACDETGKEIIPPVYQACLRHGKKGRFYYIVRDKEVGLGACDAEGKYVILPSPIYKSISYNKSFVLSEDSFDIRDVHKPMLYVPVKASLNSKGIAKGQVTEYDYYEAKEKEISKKVKRQKRMERMDRAQEALGVIGSSLSAVGSTMQNSSAQTSEVESNTEKFNSGKTVHNKNRSGNCSHCHGSRKCSQCNGDGFWFAEGSKVWCPICGGTSVCKYCKGTGKE